MTIKTISFLALLAITLLFTNKAHAQAGGGNPPPPPSIQFQYLDPYEYFADTSEYYYGQTSAGVGAIGTCEAPYAGVTATAGPIVDQITCPAQQRNGQASANSNRQVGAYIFVDDKYTNPTTGVLQVWGQMEADCVQYPNGRWIRDWAGTCG